ncbi:protein phosphatase 1, regulatory (inhibitor) subunit 14Ab isoform X2 [Boleophthalmus pectinirostris]|uniref:protein phosphatase 1, regulatory (inhibitor) subunit 14Ab isoform X2 n=1 Tax=Boleophthalmus pectinirostris TaxID=150288 RepID=UPI00243075B0|nr:protein phosphatase 1, regulatory (inhibitor) subunit 14Ab isoform X2 [Boleophthalmus pectinirostris]
MAAQRVNRRVGKPCARPCSPARSAQRHQARVTVKYDRRELQRRLDTERWLEHALHELYRGQEQLIPDELNIDELLDLKTDEKKRTRLNASGSDTDSFISCFLLKLQGLQTQEDLHNNGIELQQLHICSTRTSSTSSSSPSSSSSSSSSSNTDVQI